MDPQPCDRVGFVVEDVEEEDDDDAEDRLSDMRLMLLIPERCREACCWCVEVEVIMVVVLAVKISATKVSR